MRKLFVMIGITMMLTPTAAFAQLNTHGGGTGLVDIAAGSIPFGSVFNIRMGTSTALQWSNTLSRLTFTNGSSTAFSIGGNLWITPLATPAGTFLAVDPNGKVIATTTPAASSGTVTNIATTYPIQGGPITTTGTLTFGGLATTSPWTVGQVAYVADGNHLTSLATGTVSAGSSAITATANRYVLGGALSIDCATATGSQNGCLSSTDWTTFNSKAGFAFPFTTNAANLFFNAISNSTTTQIHLSGSPVSLSASSTAQFNTSTTTAATINALYLPNQASALLLTGAAPGLVGSYGGASACSANNFVTTISAVGGTTCGTAALNFTYTGNVSGTASANLGGTINITSPWEYTPTTYNGVQVSATSTGIWDKAVLPAFGFVASSTFFTYSSTTYASFSSTASTTDIVVSNVPSALFLGDSTGKATKYGGSSGVCTNQFPTSISALGALGTCTSVADAFFTGQLGLSHGGTNQSAFTTTGNTVYYTGSALQTSPLTSAATTPYASSTAASFSWASSTNAFFGIKVGISSSTPNAALSVGSGTASSTILVAEYAYGAPGNIATSTAMTLDARTSNQVRWALGTAATTFTLCNMYPGQTIRVVVNNPNASAGAITWATCSGSVLYWVNSTLPTQTTTANKQEAWSFIATGVTGSTTANISILGAQSPNF